MPKPDSKPFDWQDRSSPRYVVKESKNIEWAFTKGVHYVNSSVVNLMIDIVSADYVNVDMAFRPGATNSAECDKYLTEFKEVKFLINKVCQKKFITSKQGEAVWDGVDSLE